MQACTCSAKTRRGLTQCWGSLKGSRPMDMISSQAGAAGACAALSEVTRLKVVGQSSRDKLDPRWGSCHGAGTEPPVVLCTCCTGPCTNAQALQTSDTAVMPPPAHHADDRWLWQLAHVCVTPLDSTGQARQAHREPDQSAW